MEIKSIDPEKIKETMRVLPYDEAKAGVLRVISQGFGEKEEQLTDWDLSFAEYVEEHRDSSLIFAGLPRAEQRFSAGLITQVSGRCSGKGLEPREKSVN